MLVCVLKGNLVCSQVCDCIAYLHLFTDTLWAFRTGDVFFRHWLTLYSVGNAAILRNRIIQKLVILLLGRIINTMLTPFVSVLFIPYFIDSLYLNFSRVSSKFLNMRLFEYFWITLDMDFGHIFAQIIKVLISLYFMEFPGLYYFLVGFAEHPFVLANSIFRLAGQAIPLSLID